MRKKEPLVIYWAISALEDHGHRVLLANVSFNSVMRDIHRRRAKDPKKPPSHKFVQEGGYHLCTALHELVDNSFYLNAPFDIDITLNSMGQILPSERSDWFTERGQTIEGAWNVDFNYEIHLFSEEPVEVSVTPPYLHQSSVPAYGFASAAKWNISHWFRPVVILFQLWPGIHELHIKKDEPMIYLTFNTERPVIFKQFRQTSTVINISNACLRHKFMFQFLPLRTMYSKFVRQGLREDLLKEIKNNLIGETNVKN